VSVFALVGGVRSQILDFLYRTPGRPRLGERYWTGRGIARAINPKDPKESTVWKAIDRFATCGVIEPKVETRVPGGGRVVRRDAFGNVMSQSQPLKFRSEVPVRLTSLGRRVAELMGFARQEGIFKLQPQKKRLSQNVEVLAKFKEAGFTEDEVKAALCCGVIYEQPSKSYTPREGMISDPIAALKPQVRYGEIRYKYKQM